MGGGSDVPAQHLPALINQLAIVDDPVFKEEIAGLIKHSNSKVTQDPSSEPPFDGLFTVAQDHDFSHSTLPYAMKGLYVTEANEHPDPEAPTVAGSCEHDPKTAPNYSSSLADAIAQLRRFNPNPKPFSTGPRESVSVSPSYSQTPVTHEAFQPCYASAPSAYGSGFTDPGRMPCSSMLPMSQSGYSYSQSGRIPSSASTTPMGPYSSSNTQPGRMPYSLSMMSPTSPYNFRTSQPGRLPPKSMSPAGSYSYSNSQSVYMPQHWMMPTGPHGIESPQTGFAPSSLSEKPSGYYGAYASPPDLSQDLAFSDYYNIATLPDGGSPVSHGYPRQPHTTPASDTPSINGDQSTSQHSTANLDIYELLNILDVASGENTRAGAQEKGDTAWDLD